MTKVEVKGRRYPNRTIVEYVPSNIISNLLAVLDSIHYG